jgi:hypothetical protein
MSEEFSTINESDFSASDVQFNAAPITLSRMGTYVRTVANTTQTVANSSWISDLTNSATNPPFSYSGVIHEVLVFDRVLSDVERENVYGYLARKYRIDSNLPDSIRIANSGTRYSGVTYWQIDTHPNSRGLSGIGGGLPFGDVRIQDFFSMPDKVFNSRGTPLVDGTTLADDTYTVY